MKKSKTWTAGTIFSMALILFILVLTAALIVKWLDSPFRTGAKDLPKVGSSVFFQPNEDVVSADFDNEIRIVIVPPEHCITYQPKTVVEVLKKADRTIKIMVQQKATITFRKVPLTDPKCVG